jgi:prepilin peptidase CpaA
MSAGVLDIIITCVLPFFLAYAAITDIMDRRIPNRVVLAIFLLFFPAAWIAGMSWAEIGEHLAVFAVLLVFGFALFSFGIFGSGDAKLIAVAGLWLGWPDTATFLTMTVLLGGALVLVKLLIDRLAFEGGIWLPRFPKSRLGAFLLRQESSLPYGVAISAGLLFMLPFSMWMMEGSGASAAMQMAAGM